MATGNQMIHQRGEYTALEMAVASTTVLPGHLIEMVSGGTVQPHSTAGGFAELMVAQEDALQGGTVAGTYLAGAPVNIYVEARGAIALMWLKAGTAYTTATNLISNGDGTLEATTGTPKQIIGTPLTALDLSASGTVNTLWPVRVR